MLTLTKPWGIVRRLPQVFFGQTFGLRPQVCLQKIFWELSHKALGRCESSHGALPLGMFYLPPHSAFPVFIPNLLYGLFVITITLTHLIKTISLYQLLS